MTNSKDNEGSGSRRSSRRSDANSGAGDQGQPDITPIVPGTTGRYLVLFREGKTDEGVSALSSATNIAGARIANTADFEGGIVDTPKLRNSDIIVYDKLGIAVVDSPPQQIQTLSIAANEESSILAIEPERIVYSLEQDPFNPLSNPVGDVFIPAPVPPAPNVASLGLPVDYFLGYRDAVNHLVEKILAASGLPGGVTEAQAPLLETELTWGLQVTKVAASQYSGKGVKVAVLDTGFDLGHPDFVGRSVVSQSFVEGEDVQDGHGHGTHCIGTACGPKQPGQLPRYGIAYNAEIYAGKVLSNRGSGGDQGILAGINWAVTNGCSIISMSLGAPVQPGQSYSQVYETVAKRALRAGTLIIAAAGNDSNRPGDIRPVGHPANCPSILAVAALDQSLGVSFFSNGGLNPQGGQIDIAAPGRNVRSSWPRPNLYNTISGTSMATPHVAGIAALFAEANPTLRGRALQALLLQGARRLNLPSRDVGAGIVQAP